jgi:phage minor structural protein
MLTVFNQNMEAVAILQNAFNVSYEKTFNELWFAEFTLPLQDEKNKHCKPFYFVEIIDNDNEYIGLFRIMPTLIRRNEGSKTVTYELYHALSTLLSDVIEGYEQTTNLTTQDNISMLLSKQTVRHWRLKDCEFTRYFHYKFENENGLLSPIFSIPKPFDEEYEWRYNTKVYPFELSLVKPSQEVEWNIRYAHNLIGIEKKEDPLEIVNRIYPRGYGEGTNQLTIASVNNGVTYLEDAESIQKYGLQQYIWTDRRFEDAESLKANGQSLLSQWKDPKVVYRTTAADLSSLTGNSVDRHRVGQLGQIIDPYLGTIIKRIVKESKGDLTGKKGKIDLEIGSLTDNIATTTADIQRKIEVNEAYSQGSTNLMNFDYNDNADDNYPAIIRFFVPEEATKINKLDLSFETSEFRAYGRATQSGGSNVITTTSASGGGQTTSSGGGQTTSAGGGQTTSAGGGQTSSEDGSHYHRLFVGGNPSSVNFTKRRYFAYLKSQDVATTINLEADTGGDVYTYEAEGSHTHTVSNHTHSVANHTHSVSDHTHSVSDHSHQVKVTIPPHSHELDHGIFTLDTVPSSVVIKVDGNTVPYTSTNGDNIDLVPYMDKDNAGNVLRGQFHELEIKPNGLGRINAQVFMQLFLQSRGKYTV